MKKFTLSIAAALVVCSAVAAPKMRMDESSNPSNLREFTVADAKVRLNQFENEQDVFQYESQSNNSCASRFDADEIITQAPEGVKRLYSNSNQSWAYTMMGGLVYFVDAEVTETVWCENGDVYIKDIVSGSGFGSYVKGTYADGKVTVKFPQAVQVTDFGTRKFTYYATCVDIEFDFETKVMQAYEANGESQITYTVADDFSSMKLDLNEGFTYDGTTYPEHYVGVWAKNDGWTALASAVQDLTLVEDKPLQLPAGLTAEEWTFMSDEDNFTVNVATDDNNIYVSGFANAPEAWIKGEIKGDKVEFPVSQYMGLVKKNFVFFDAMSVVDSENRVYAKLGKLVFDYDSAKRKMTVADSKHLFVIGYTPNNPTYYLKVYNNVVLRAPDLTLTDANPMNPSLVKVFPFDYSFGCGTVTFNIPNVNVHGEFLDTSRMYFNFYVDDELYGFDPSVYIGLSEYTENIPYDYQDDFDFMVNGQSHLFLTYIPVMDTIGIQSFYKGTDDKLYSSDLVSFDALTGETLTAVAEIDVDRQAVSVSYTNMLGQKVDNPSSGLYIRTAIYSDGTMKSSKMLIRK